MENENDIDQLFRQGLNEPEIPFNELDWEKMERKLDAQEPKKLIPLWVYTASGIAAVLAVFLTWIIFSPEPSKQIKNNQSLTKTHSKDQPAKQKPLINQVLPDLKDTVISDQQLAVAPLRFVSPSGTATPIKKAIDELFSPAVSGSKIQEPVVKPAGVNKTTVDESIAKVVPGAVKENKGQMALKNESDSAALIRKANALANSKDVYGRVEQQEIESSVRKKMESALTQKQHDLILSALAAPDISTVKSSKPSKISTNLGMTATYAFTQKISVTSGAVYSKKYYNYGNSGDNPSGNTWEVDADCNVLDIPLNVNYKILHKKKLSVSVNTGLSSYFMLKEKYQYTVGQPGAEKVTNVEFDNQNQHIFGIANVSVSFDHQISDNVSVGVQPFAKLPLTGIGNNNANLKSAGVSFSLNIGLFPSKKPGKYAAARYSSLR